IFAAHYPTSVPVSCTSPRALVKKIKAQKSRWGKTKKKRALAKPGTFSSLTYAAGTMQYHTNWTTEAEWAGTCRLLVIGLTDNTVYTQFFDFRSAEERSDERGPRHTPGPASRAGPSSWVPNSREECATFQ